MDAKLKAKLNEAVEAALQYWKKRGGPPPKPGPVSPKPGPVSPKPGPASPKPGPASPESEHDALTEWLVHMVRRRLRKDALWRKFQAEVATDSLAQIFKAKLKPRKPVHEQQLIIPGYEHLPQQIRVGNSRPGLFKAPVPLFLDYEARYQLRTQRDQQTAEELRRLAQTIRPFADSGLTVGAAFDRAQGRVPGLVVVKPKSA